MHSNTIFEMRDSCFCIAIERRMSAVATKYKITSRGFPSIDMASLNPAAKEKELIIYGGKLITDCPEAIQQNSIDMSGVIRQIRARIFFLYTIKNAAHNNATIKHKINKVPLIKGNNPKGAKSTAINNRG